MTTAEQIAFDNACFDLGMAEGELATTVKALIEIRDTVLGSYTARTIAWNALASLHPMCVNCGCSVYCHEDRTSDGDLARCRVCKCLDFDLGDDI